MSLGSDHTGWNGHGPKPGAGAHRSAAPPPNDGEVHASPPDSEAALRHLKASESVAAALQAVGLHSGGEMAAVITDYVKGQTKNIPVSQLGAGGPMAISAAAGVGQYLAAMTPEQRRTAQQGVPVPPDAAALAKLAATLQLGVAGRGPVANDRDAAGTRASADGTAKASPGLWEPSSGGAGLTAKNFGGTEFCANGLDLGTTKAMFRQGFDRHEIVTAAKDAGSLGVPVNKDAPLIADLNRHDPQFMPRAHQSKDHWHQYYRDENDIKRNDENIAKLREAGKSAEADALQAKNDAAKTKHDRDRKHHEQFDNGTVQSTSEPRRRKARTVLDDIRRNEQQLSPNLDAHEKASGIDADTSKKIIRSYHHNPNDPIASGKYAALLQSGDHSPASDKAVAEIGKTVRQAAQLKKIQIAANTKDFAANVVKTKRVASSEASEIDLFASMTGGAPADSKAAKVEEKPTGTKAAAVEPKKHVTPKPAQKIKVAGVAAPTA